MSTWIATTLALAITAVTAGTAVNAGSCVPRSSYHCVGTGLAVDLHSVPDITKKIVGEDRLPKNRTSQQSSPQYRRHTRADSWRNFGEADTHCWLFLVVGVTELSAAV
jgi:hypothetical protein